MSPAGREALEPLARVCRKHPGASKAVAGIVAFFVLLTVAGFFIAPPLLRSFLEKKLAQTLHRKVAIGGIAINPYALSVSVRGFSVKERDGRADFISLSDLYVNVEAASVVKGGLVLREIRLARPYVNVVRDPDGRYNFSDLVEEFAAKPKEGGKPARYSLNNIRIDNGAINFWDGPMRKGHEVREMTVHVPFLSNLPYDVGTFVQPLFQARINGDAVRVAGRTKPFQTSLESIVDLNVTDLDIPRYMAYSPVQPGARLKSARLDTKADLTFARFPDKPPAIGLKGTFVLRDVDVVDRGGRPMVAFPRLDVGVISSDLFATTVGLSTVILERPRIAVRLDPGGRLNFMDFKGGVAPAAKEAGKADNVSAAAKDAGKAEAGRAVRVDAERIEVRNGTVTFEDRTNGRRFDTVLDNLAVTVSPFTTAEGKDSKLSVSLKTETGERVSADGALRVDPAAFRGAVGLQGISLKKYAPYYGKAVLCDVLGGTADLSGTLDVAMGPGGSQAAVTGLSVDVGSLSLRRRGDAKEFLKIPVFSIRNASMDTQTREVVLGAVSTRKGLVELRREADGTLNVASLVPPSPPPAREGPKAKTSGSGADVPEGAWTITLPNLSLEAYAVRWIDRTTSSPVEISVDPVRVTAENISTRKRVRGKASVACRIEGKGKVSVQGTVGLNPAAADLRLDLQNIDVAPFQPYFADVVRILITDGAVGAKGTLSLDASGKEFRGRYRGEAGVSRFASLDKDNSEEFLRFESLHADKIDAGFPPFGLSIDEVALSSFSSRIVVNPDGTLNVQGIVGKRQVPGDNAAAVADAKEGADRQAGAPAEPAAPVRISRVTLQGGSIAFTDSHVRPGYSAVLREVGGRISGLSSEESARAEVDLRGTYEGSAPLSITGAINPLSRDLFVDLKVDFRDMDLSPLTPYSGKYAGYAIEKGKLSMGLSYLIANRKLDSQNVLRIDQFNFGEKVESPDATKLPVRLAVALLKNRNGEIRLDLPVSGSIDDPKFSIWRIVVKIIVNLLVKAATSPFALLGALFGGGEELSYVEYDPGAHVLSGPSAGKVASLVKALHDRPALRLDIIGRVDVEHDREALRQETFRRKIRMQKFKESAGKGKAADALDNVVVTPAEYPRFLELAYRQEKFPKPRNIIGMVRKLPVPEMEKLMMTHIQIGEDDLRQLALRRAATVRDALLASKQVEAERIFLVEPKTLAPEKKEKVRDSRVDFVLK